MLETEIELVLDQIIKEMDTVAKKDASSLKVFNETLAELLKKLPSAKFESIQSPALRKKVQTIWLRTFAKFQGKRNGKKFSLGTLNIKTRLMLVQHGFYIDYTTKSGKTILFQCFDVLNHTLSAPILDGLITHGTLNSILGCKFESKRAKTCENIFEHIESHLDRAIARGAATNSVKFLQWKKFAIDLINQLTERKIAHSFSAKIADKLSVSSKKRTIKPPPETLQPKTKILRFSTENSCTVSHDCGVIEKQDDMFAEIGPLPQTPSFKNVMMLFDQDVGGLIDEENPSNTARPRHYV